MNGTIGQNAAPPVVQENNQGPEVVQTQPLLLVVMIVLEIISKQNPVLLQNALVRTFTIC